MMIECPRHGERLGVWMSPDLVTSLGEGRRPPVEYLEIQYVHDGDPVHRMLISDAFASKEGIPHEDTLPLPDDYPDWFHKLVTVCERCLP
jgi:hypothetical protein